MRLARLLVLLVLALALPACGGGDDGSGGGTTASAEGAGCNVADLPEPKPDGGQTAPEAPLDAETTYRLRLETNCGSFTITLDQASAPHTAASLVSLARDGFYDGTHFHRVVPGFVIQGGDPTGTGTGGPGYSTVDPPPPGATYTQGVVAMAKAAAEAPGTAGSQFFVVTGGDIGLPPEYAVVGTVTAGMETVREIDQLGVGDGPPSTPVVVDKVTVEEG
jgi:cyclophilin family peptidyl-prolyl cis-trans isomerase